jgi:hypothetical protein
MLLFTLRRSSSHAVPVYIYLVKNFDNPAELGNLVWYVARW